jgi:hypothetical protein
MPAAATVMAVRSMDASSSTRSRRELPISNTPSRPLSYPVSGKAWNVSASAPRPTVAVMSRLWLATRSMSGLSRAAPGAGPDAPISSDAENCGARLR